MNPQKQVGAPIEMIEPLIDCCCFDRAHAIAQFPSFIVQNCLIHYLLARHWEVHAERQLMHLFEMAGKILQPRWQQSGSDKTALNDVPAPTGV